MGNKTDEIRILNLAKNQCLKQRGISKEIGKMLCGKDIPRTLDEHPDFLKSYTANGKNTLVGIEVLKINQFSERHKDGKVNSSTFKLDKIVKSMPQTSQNTDTQSSNNAECYRNIIGELINLELPSTYNAYIESFRYSLEKHIEKIEDYYQQIQLYANDYDKKLILLLDIRSDFGRMFSHDANGQNSYKKIFPLFDDMVKILEHLESTKVNYVVLCFSNITEDDNVSVIAISTTNIRKQLEKIHRSVYCYAGYDMCLPDFKKPRILSNINVKPIPADSSLKFAISAESYEFEDDVTLFMVIKAYLCMKEFQLHKLPYVTDILVEMFNLCYDKYYSVMKDKNIDEIISIVKMLRYKYHDDICQKCQSFYTTYIKPYNNSNLIIS